MVMYAIINGLESDVHGKIGPSVIVFIYALDGCFAHIFEGAVLPHGGGYEAGQVKPEGVWSRSVE